MAEVPLYVELDPELKQVLIDSGISIQDVLDQNNIDCEVKYGRVPAGEDSDTTTRSLGLTILAAGGSFFLIMEAIRRFLVSKSRKPVHLVWEELEPVLDSSGNPVRDQNGEIIMKETIKSNTLGPNDSLDPASLEFQAGLKGVLFKYHTTEESESEE
jgi:hypothetical protein